MLVIINQLKSAFLHDGSCMQWRRLVLEVRAVLGGGEVHLDVVKGFALAEVVVVCGSEESGAVAANYGLQVTAVDVEGHSFESVHFVVCGRSAGSELN